MLRRRALVSAAGLSAVLLALRTEAQERPAARPPSPACYDQAQTQLLLDESAAARLCRGARGLGPIRCYEAADTQLVAEEDTRMVLCRCASSSRPVRCFDEVSSMLDFDDRAALRACSPTLRYGARACLPVPYPPP